MTGPRYREALLADVPDLARLRALTWGSEEYWRTRIAAYMKAEWHPKHAGETRVVYVAEERGSLVGLIAGHLTRRYGCDGELEWIDVVPGRRGSGVAQKLLRRLAEWFAGQKASRVCVDVEPSNATARRFYMRHGAQELNPHWLVWEDIRIALRERRSSGKKTRGAP